MAANYQFVLLPTVNGDFFVSLPADAAANINQPELIFEPGSQILAHENAAPAGSQVERQPDNVGEHKKGSGAVWGEFTVQFENGRIKLDGPQKPCLLTSLV